MEFIDHTGHVFSLPSYQEEPIGYEYETNPYIFWLDDEYTNKLSINNYYIKPIRLLFDKSENFDFTEVSIYTSSNIFKLLSSDKIQKLLENSKSYNNIEIAEEDFTTSLKTDDLAIIDNISQTLYWTVTKKYNVITCKHIYPKYSYTNELGDYIETDNNIFSEGKVVTINKVDYVIKYKIDKTATAEIVKPYWYYQKNGDYFEYAYYVNDENEDVPILNYYVEKGVFVVKDGTIYTADDYSTVVTVDNEGYCENKYYYLSYVKTHNTYKVVEIDEEDVNSDEQYDNGLYIIKNNEQECVDFIDNNPENLKVKDIIYSLLVNNLQKEQSGDIESLSIKMHDVYNNIYLACGDKTIASFDYSAVDHKYALIPFYIVGNANSEGTWSTNVLIQISNGYEYNYTHITVGGVFYNEIEELIIDGKNMGISLPKDIIKALYNTSYYNYYNNEELYNEKIKEYLINYMAIRGEQGNFNSALTSLKWFGWGDKISIAKLIQTDNEFINQYIIDYFSINNDTLHSYENFRKSTFIELLLKENNELTEEYPIDFSKTMWGEGKPKLENLFDKTIGVKYDEQDITFYRSYYNFVFEELGLKLSCLAYYYQKYFLPLHLKIHNASIRHQVFVNDIKFKTASYIKYSEQPVLMQDNNIRVSFTTDTYYINKTQHYVDSNYNEFTDTKENAIADKLDAYYIDDNCITIPIQFSGATYYDCVLVLEKINGNGSIQIFESKFKFVQNENTQYSNFILYPKYINKKFDYLYWLNSTYRIHLCVNDKWFSHTFRILLSKVLLNMGKLEYKYWINESENIEGFSQLTEDMKYKSFMYNDGLVKMYDIRLDKKLLSFDKSTSKLNFDGYVQKNSWYDLLEQYNETPNLYKHNKYLNRVHLFDLYDSNGNKIKYDKFKSYHELYDNFFYTEDIYYEFDNSDEKILEHRRGDAMFDLGTSVKYDFYLMHDNYSWHVILISKMTLSSLDVNDIYIIDKSITFGDYTLKFVKSDNKFLINRMFVNWTLGKNIFSETDIIVAELNENIAFNYDIGTKWQVIPKSVTASNKITCSSNANMMIISVGETNIKNIPGIYSINVRYSIDDYIQHQEEISCIYKVNKS